MAKSKFQKLSNEAATTGNLDNLKNWIEEQINYKDQRNQETVLHKAIESGHLNVVKYFIQIGAQIDAKKKDGGLPFTMLQAKAILTL